MDMELNRGDRIHEVVTRLKTYVSRPEATDQGFCSMRRHELTEALKISVEHAGRLYQMLPISLRDARERWYCPPRVA